MKQQNLRQGRLSQADEVREQRWPRCFCDHQNLRIIVLLEEKRTNSQNDLEWDARFGTQIEKHLNKKIRVLIFLNRRYSVNQNVLCYGAQNFVTIYSKGREWTVSIKKELLNKINSYTKMWILTFIVHSVILQLQIIFIFQ